MPEIFYQEARRSLRQAVFNGQLGDVIIEHCRYEINTQNDKNSELGGGINAAVEFESAQLLDHLFLNIPAAAYVENFLQTFKEYPPRQRAEGITFQQTIEKMQEAAGGQ